MKRPVIYVVAENTPEALPVFTTARWLEALHFIGKRNETAPITDGNGGKVVAHNERYIIERIYA